MCISPSLASTSKKIALSPGLVLGLPPLLFTPCLPLHPSFLVLPALSPAFPWVPRLFSVPTPPRATAAGRYIPTGHTCQITTGIIFACFCLPLWQDSGCRDYTYLSLD